MNFRNITTSIILPIKIIYTGENKIQFSAKPSCAYGLNNIIDGVTSSQKLRKNIIGELNLKQMALNLKF